MGVYSTCGSAMLSAERDRDRDRDRDKLRLKTFLGVASDGRVYHLWLCYAVRRC